MLNLNSGETNNSVIFDTKPKVNNSTGGEILDWILDYNKHKGITYQNGNNVSSWINL